MKYRSSRRKVSLRGGKGPPLNRTKVGEKKNEVQAPAVVVLGIRPEDNKKKKGDKKKNSGSPKSKDPKGSLIIKPRPEGSQFEKTGSQQEKDAPPPKIGK